MTINSKALYLGNIGNENCGFTVGKEYKIHDFKGGYIVVCDDYDNYRRINNGAFHKFCLLKDDDGLKVTIPDEFITKEEKQFKYYINGEVVTKVKFDDTLLCVKEFKSDGVDTSSIKFEVKFQ